MEQDHFEENARRSREGQKGAILGVISNAALGAAKIIGGLLGNSYALIADGMESMLDIFASLMVWSGLRIASKPPDKGHPYGHGKAESLMAIAVSMLLIVASIAIAVESVRALFFNPGVAEKPEAFTLIVLVTVIITKGIMFAVIQSLGRSVESSSLKAEAWHHMADMITSIAALIGISLAVFANMANADKWAALIVSAIIGLNGVLIFRSGLSEIMDAEAAPEVERRVREIASSVTDALAIGKCFITKSGMGYLIQIHVIVDDNLTVSRGHEIGHEVKRALQESQLNVIDVIAHVEPQSGRRSATGDQPVGTPA